MNQTGVTQAGNRVLLHAHRRHAEAVNDVLARELDDDRPVDRHVQLVLHDDVVASAGRVRSRPSGFVGDSRATRRRRAELAVRAGIVHVPDELLGDDPHDQSRRPIAGWADVRANQTGSANTTSSTASATTTPIFDAERDPAASRPRASARGCRAAAKPNEHPARSRSPQPTNSTSISTWTSVRTKSISAAWAERRRQKPAHGADRSRRMPVAPHVARIARRTARTADEHADA